MPQSLIQWLSGPTLRRALVIALLPALAACAAPRAQAPAPPAAPRATIAPTSAPTLPPTPAPPTPTRASASPTVAATTIPTRAASPLPPTATPPPSTATRPASPVVTLPPPPVPTTSARGSTPAQAGPIVTYEKSGGLKGARDTLVIYDDGRVELTNRTGAKKTGQIAQDVVFTLKQRIAQVDWAQLKPRYQVGGADMFNYTVTVTQPNGAASTVTTMDTAPHPAALQQLLTALDQIAQQAQ